MNRLLLLQLVRSKKLNRIIIHKLLNKDPVLHDLRKLLTYPASHISNYYNIPLSLSKKIKEALEDKETKQDIKEDSELCHVVTIFDDIYPTFLKEIVDPPLVLYVLGNKLLLNEERRISVIGTRQPSKEAWEKVSKVISPLIDDKWMIVSGLAKGIDSFAHKVTLNNNGKTIAVLGHGFHYTYPKENEGLLHLIKNHGLVIT